jgi:hypothetical protein
MKGLLFRKERGTNRLVAKHCDRKGMWKKFRRHRYNTSSVSSCMGLGKALNIFRSWLSVFLSTKELRCPSVQNMKALWKSRDLSCLMFPPCFFGERAVLGCEPRASYMLGKHCTTWATTSRP